MVVIQMPLVNLRVVAVVLGRLVEQAQALVLLQ